MSARAARRTALAWFSRRRGRVGWALVLPAALWLLVFFVLPLVAMLGTSVLARGMYGGVEWRLTLEHFQRVVEPLYLAILGKTLAQSALCTLLCVVLGYPVAWLMANAGRWKNLLVFLVILPFWTSFLVRTFAMIFMLRDTGLVNSILLGLGLVEEPLSLLHTPFAIQLGLVYGLLPFMILPIYTSLEKLDPTLLEAAEVLGARPAARFTRVILPLSLPGVMAGTLLVFIPALGMYLVGDLLGGSKDMMIGNLIQNQFTTARNWPFGSAASFVVMALVLAASVAANRLRDTLPGGKA